MKNYFFLLCILIVSCNTSNKSSIPLSHYVPEDSQIVLSTGNFESLMSDLDNNDIISRIQGFKNYDVLRSKLSALDSLKLNSNIYICIDKIGDSLNYLLVSKLNDSITNNSQALEANSVFTKVIDSVLLISDSQERLNRITGPSKKSFFNSSTQVSNKSFSLSVKDNETSFFDFFLNDSLPKNAGVSNFNVSLLPEQIKINGISKPVDSTSFFEELFKENMPQENTIQNITPSTANGFISYTYTNFSKLHGQLNSLKLRNADSTINLSVFESASEIGEIYFNHGNAIVLKSIDATSTRDALLEYQDSSTTYRNIEIFKITNDSIFEPLSPLITKSTVTNYMVLDDFFIFSNSVETLQNIIANSQNNATLSNDVNFSTCMTYLSDESSALLVVNSELLKDKLSKVFNQDFSASSLDSYKLSAFQIIQDDSFIHFNGIISKAQNRTTSNVIREEFSAKIDQPILVAPHFVTNHRTNQKEIVVQDINNTLYLISNRGKILWKKRLNGEILGKVQQVDLYKNGRLQLAFATPKRMYIIDRNGNDVSPFPLKFNDEITQPLSVFDYDKNKKYRFVVVQNNNILLYDNKGKSVRGFNYSKSGIITSQPKHIRVNSRDYITFVAGGKMQILNRRGKVRIPSNTSFEHSGNAVYFYKNAFSTTTTNGNLVQVSLTGNFSEQPLSLEDYHLIDATSKTLVALSENNLKIKQNNYELDFGDYTQPKIFYINDKIYVSVTDRQSNRVFMFDSQARLISNFPVYGNSTIDFSNIDGDNKLEFTTIGDANTVIVYEKN